MAKNKAKPVMKTINIQTRSITICKQQTMMQIDNLELSDEQKRCMLSTTTRSKYSLLGLGQNLEATTPLPAAHEAGDLVRRNNKRAHSGDQETAGSRVGGRFKVGIGGRGFLMTNQWVCVGGGCCMRFLGD